MNPKISFIIPVFNEQENLPKLFETILQFTEAEIIFVDGGSNDQSIHLIEQIIGKRNQNIQLIHTGKSRSKQMNAGADISKGEMLVFLHADTKIQKESADYLAGFVDSKKAVVGSYKFKVDSPNLKFRMLEFFVEVRNYLFKLPYGDQVFFVSRDLWNSVGKFKEIMIMEDLEWIKRVSTNHDLMLLPFYAETDGRRWKKNGFIKNSALNLYLQFRYFCGDDPSQLHKLYYNSN